MCDIPLTLRSCFFQSRLILFYLIKVSLPNVVYNNAQRHPKIIRWVWFHKTILSLPYLEGIGIKECIYQKCLPLLVLNTNSTLIIIT